MFILQCDMCGRVISTLWNSKTFEEIPNCMKIEWEQLNYKGNIDFFKSSEYLNGSIYVCDKCANCALECFAFRGKTESF